MEITYDEKKRYQFRSYVFYKVLFSWPLKHSKFKENAKDASLWAFKIIDDAFLTLTSESLDSYRQKGGASVYFGQELNSFSAVFMDMFEELFFSDFDASTNRFESFTKDLIFDLQVSVKSLWDVVNKGSPALKENGEANMLLEKRLRDTPSCDVTTLTKLCLFTTNAIRSKRYIPFSVGLQSEWVEKCESISKALVEELTSLGWGDETGNSIVRVLAFVTAGMGYLFDATSPEIPFNKDLFRPRDRVFRFVSQEQSSFENDWWQQANENYQILKTELDDVVSGKKKIIDNPFEETDTDYKSWNALEEDSPLICAVLRWIGQKISDEAFKTSEEAVIRPIILSIHHELFFGLLDDSFLGQSISVSSFAHAIKELYVSEIDNLEEVLEDVPTECEDPFISFQSGIANLSASLSRLTRSQMPIFWKNEVERMREVVSSIVSKACATLDNVEIEMNGASKPLLVGTIVSANLAWAFSFNEPMPPDEIEKKSVSTILLIVPEANLTHNLFENLVPGSDDGSFTSKGIVATIAKFVTSYVVAYSELASAFGLLEEQVLFAAAFNDLHIDLEEGNLSLQTLSQFVSSAYNCRVAGLDLRSDSFRCPQYGKREKTAFLCFNIAFLSLKIDNPSVDESLIAERILELKDVILEVMNERLTASDDVMLNCRQSAKNCLSNPGYLSLIRAFCI